MGDVEEASFVWYGHGQGRGRLAKLRACGRLRRSPGGLQAVLRSGEVRHRGMSAKVVRVDEAAGGTAVFHNYKETMSVNDAMIPSLHARAHGSVTPSVSMTWSATPLDQPKPT